MSLRLSKPVFIENSKIIMLFSFISQIEIKAITLGPIVISTSDISDTTRNHETIHWQQYIELGILLFPILYLVYWIAGLIKYRSVKIAYYQIPFEQEAYRNQENSYYVLSRKRWCWIRCDI